MRGAWAAPGVRNRRQKSTHVPAAPPPIVPIRPKAELPTLREEGGGTCAIISHGTATDPAIIAGGAASGSASVTRAFWCGEVRLSRARASPIRRRQSGSAAPFRALPWRLAARICAVGTPACEHSALSTQASLKAAAAHITSSPEAHDAHTCGRLRPVPCHCAPRPPPERIHDVQTHSVVPRISRPRMDHGSLPVEAGALRGLGREEGWWSGGYTPATTHAAEGWPRISRRCIQNVKY